MGKGGKGSYKHRQKRKQAVCAVALALLVGVVTLLAVLYFTDFRPRDPRVDVMDVQLLSLDAPPAASPTGGYPPVSANLTLFLKLSLHNPNRASFHMQDGGSLSLVFHGTAVGSIPLQGGAVIPARSTKDFSVQLTATEQGGPHIYADAASSIVHVTSSVAIVGKVTTLSIFSHRSKVVSNCDINVSLIIRGIVSYSCQKNISLDA
ncbi:hypothetical protein KP509_18G048500 [Ceratopteris richardii]|uniref:Late embryogenesis abundant protein LEA-2 subgroup domain-containing protein n=1 Tax=Ceratopteris richardii TaxID=49495 RepID=A0A8T2ST73_CERRI|nr:hypothetical protein KP509_18G048500 [Ceratopteris richardii]